MHVVLLSSSLPPSPVLIPCLIPSFFINLTYRGKDIFQLSELRSFQFISLFYLVWIIRLKLRSVLFLYYFAYYLVLFYFCTTIKASVTILSFYYNCWSSSSLDEDDLYFTAPVAFNVL